MGSVAWQSENWPCCQLKLLMAVMFSSVTNFIQLRSESRVCRNNKNNFTDNYTIMFELKIQTGRRVTTILINETSLAVDEIFKELENRNLPRGLFYIQHNGRLVSDDSVARLGGCATLVPRILGGKGGFGSMLRAIGAQIEKTTNREACRDLSGRRLRDINEEKRLKAWIEKQESREEEETLRKKRKLEKLCAVPKHEFKDQKYEEERSCLTDRVGDAIEAGFKAAAVTAAAIEIEERAKRETKKNVRKTILDDDIDSDELDSLSDDSDEFQDTPPKKKLATESNNSASIKFSTGCSSDESHQSSSGSSGSSTGDDAKSSNDPLPYSSTANENPPSTSTVVANTA